MCCKTRSDDGNEGFDAIRYMPAPLSLGKVKCPHHIGVPAQDMPVKQDQVREEHQKPQIRGVQMST
jgi:hypothetical protein